MVPKSLKVWFLIHFILDIVAGFPLLFFPNAITGFLGFEIIQTLPLRLVGAALIGIGGTSLIKVNESVESYNSLLTLKIIWSLFAVVGILLSIIEGAPKAVWGILVIFSTFNIVWFYYYFKLKTK